MPIQLSRVCIVGVGLIGGSLGLAARAGGVAAQRVGVEPDRGAWDAALRLGTVDAITDDLAEGVRGADLVILAVPVGAILDLLPRLAPLVGVGTLVTDVGSVKTPILRAAAVLPYRFVGGHPMAGSEKGGVTHARADLFAGAAWAICAPPGGATDDAEYLRDFVGALGANPILLQGGEAHDEAVALTSHLPHVIAYALCAAMAARPGLPPLSGGSWASATRVAESSPELWAGIASQNAVPLAAAIRAFAAELGAVAAALETGDTHAVAERFAVGHAAKRGGERA